MRRILGTAPSNSNDEVPKSYVDALQPTGAITMYGGPTAPSGWLRCDGSAVSRTTYASLWAVIGASFGAGDGSTTFNLPDLASNFPRGNTVPGGTGGGGTHYHGLTSASTALHSHTSAAHSHTSAAHSHPLSGSGQAQVYSTTSGLVTRNIGTAAYTDTNLATVSGSNSAASRTTGVALAGNTDPTTPGVTGTTTPNNTGNASATSLVGTTDPDSAMPPFVDLAFIIKF